MTVIKTGGHRDVCTKHRNHRKQTDVILSV